MDRPNVAGSARRPVRAPRGRRPGENSAHGGAGLSDRPAVPLQVVGHVEGEPPRTGEPRHDCRPVGLGPTEMRFDVLNVHPRYVRADPLRPVVLELEQHQRAVAHAELDPRMTMLALGARLVALTQWV